jgi:rod shape-determining protein MreD
LQLIPNRQLQWRTILDGTVIIGSVLLCALVLPMRLPGMELLGLGPNWLLIWVVAWSVKRTAWQGAIAGLALGLIQDGMTSPFPSHAISLACVGFLTARLRKQKYIQEDFISVALIVFGMAVVAETVMALQFWVMAVVGEMAIAPQLWVSQFWAKATRAIGEIWVDYQRIALASAILSSLWAPVVYYPLNRCWKRTNLLEQS